MAKQLTQKIEDMIESKQLKIQFIIKVATVDYTDYLTSWQIQFSKEFGSASATFVLTNQDGIFSEGGANQINVGDKVEFIEKFQGDASEFKKFYGIVNQRSVTKSSQDRSITIVCLDYISTLQFMDIDLDVEGEKVKVENETLTPNFLPAPNDTLAQVFDFANDSLADNPRPILSIRNKDTAAEDPAYDGFQMYYENGQVKLGFPLNAQDNYDFVAVNYYYYTKGVYAEDVLEAILLEPDGYGNYLFGESSAQDVIDNHLTETHSNVDGDKIETLTPNFTASEITLYSQVSQAYTTGNLYVDDITMFPTSGEASINGDIFTWTGRTEISGGITGILTGISGLGAHPEDSWVKYTATYTAGQVWYLTYSNLFTQLDSDDFTLGAGTFRHLDKRNGRIILESAVPTSSSMVCDSDYSFNTLQASGIQLNRITFRPREMENRLEAVKKIKGYLAPNYVIRTLGDDKIWASYLSQNTTADYDLNLVTDYQFLEDEDLFTRVIFYGKNNNPTNLMFKDGVDFIGTGETYKGIATNIELVALREEGNYYVYGNILSGVGKITANSIQPSVRLNEVPIDNNSHVIAGQQVALEITTRTVTETSGGGK